MEDVGVAIFNGLQKLGEKFADDIVSNGDKAVGEVGSWGDIYVGSVSDFRDGVNDEWSSSRVRSLTSNHLYNRRLTYIPIITADRLVAFNDAANKTVENWSNQRFTLGDIIILGRGVLDGIDTFVNNFIANGVINM